MSIDHCFCVSSATCPVWVIKTRLQLQHTRKQFAVTNPSAAAAAAAAKATTGSEVEVVYTGFFHAERVIWRTEGLRGMFKVCTRPSRRLHEKGAVFMLVQ